MMKNNYITFSNTDLDRRDMLSIIAPIRREIKKYNESIWTVIENKEEDDLEFLQNERDGLERVLAKVKRITNTKTN